MSEPWCLLLDSHPDDPPSSRSFCMFEAGHDGTCHRWNLDDDPDDPCPESITTDDPFDEDHYCHWCGIGAWRASHYVWCRWLDLRERTVTLP